MYLNICKAYTFGDKILDTRFQNTAIYALVETCTTPLDGKRQFPGLSAIKYVYNNTRESALVRKLLVDMYIYAGEDTWFWSWKEKLRGIPQSFLLELASKLLGQPNRYIGDSGNVKASPHKPGP